MIRIREATPADARAIAEVHVEGWTWGYRGLLPDDVIAARDVERRATQWDELLADDDDGATRLVAIDEDGRIVGFVACGAADAEHVAPPEGAGEIYAIYLLERVRGTGVGRDLFARAVEALRAAGFRNGVLWVLATNDLARRFYEAAGWHADGAVGEHRYDCANQPIVRYAADL